jgi:hypothetical protein
LLSLPIQLCWYQKLAFDLSAFFLISKMNFEKGAYCFFMSNPAFSQAYVLRPQLLFAPVETGFTALCFFKSRFFYYQPQDPPHKSQNLRSNNPITQK